MAQALQTTDRQVPNKLDGSERTRSRQVFVPRADIYETQDQVVLLIDMPGVGSDGVDIRARPERVERLGHS